MFKFPQSLHITSYYAGGKHSSSPCYTEFREGVSLPIEVKAVAYVPGSILTGVCFPDQSLVKVENQCPHLTMMVGKWKPVMSNTLLEHLFIDENTEDLAPLSQPYREGFFQSDDSREIRKIPDLEIEQVGKRDVYLIKQEPMRLEAVSGCHNAAQGGNKKGGKNR